MMKLLVVHSSINHPMSTSREIASQLVQGLKEALPENSVKIRDLLIESPGHWGEDQIKAAFTNEDKRSPAQEMALAKSDEYCREILNCTHLIISSPMWNYSIPSVLKAWIDHIVRVDVTFRYGLKGPEGLAKNLERVYIIESAGGIYNGESAQFNHVGPYLGQVFRFMGAREVNLISAYGTATDPKRAFKQALEQIECMLGDEMGKGESDGRPK